jgi:phosphoglycolate phosphatase-like HAD superfamily hydrolase
MRIVIDMDNTLVDELGAKLRPGIIAFLEEIAKTNELFLWTNSKKSRAYDILTHHGIRKYFDKLICREDYDPMDQGVRKDIRKINADMIIDDDPAEIEFNRKNRKAGFLVQSFRSNAAVSKNELNDILKEIQRRR